MKAAICILAVLGAFFVYVWSRIATSGPSCFGDYPIRLPHAQAERDCVTCPVFSQCIQRTPWPKIP